MSDNRNGTLRAFEPVTGGPAWREAEAAGFDMSLLIASARMTVWERICEHRAALNLATALREARAKTTLPQDTQTGKPTP